MGTASQVDKIGMQIDLHLQVLRRAGLIKGIEAGAFEFR